LKVKREKLKFKKFLLSMKINFPAIKKTFKVPSKSEKGKFHFVELYEDGTLECDCIAGLMKRNCRHKKAVIEFLFPEKKKLRKWIEKHPDEIPIIEEKPGGRYDIKD